MTLTIITHYTVYTKTEYIETKSIIKIFHKSPLYRLCKLLFTLIQ